MPPELIAYRYIKEFGVRAVLGRDVLSAGEMRRMIYCANIAQWFREHDAAGREGGIGWAKWEEANPDQAEALNEAMLAAYPREE